MRRIPLINSLRRGRGFTIVELIIVITVLGLIFPLSIMIINSYKDTVFSDDKVKTSVLAQRALYYMDDSVRVASAFLTAVPSPFTDAYGPHNAGSSGSEAWSYKGDSASSRVLMTQSYATTVNPSSTGRLPVYENTPAFNCTTQMHYQTQLPFVTVYFVKDSVLYKRTLTDTTTALCPGNTQQQKQSCPPYIAKASLDASCQARDEVLITNVNSFSVAYYQSSSDGTSTQLDSDYTSTDPTILVSADYAVVTITTSTRNGQVMNTISQRLTKVNS